MFRRRKQQCNDDTYSVKSSLSRNSFRSFISRNSRNSCNSRKSRNSKHSQSAQQLLDGSKKWNESSFLELAEMGKFDDIYLILSGSNREGLLPWLSGNMNNSINFEKSETPLHIIMIYQPTVAVVDILIQRLNELSLHRSSARGICRPEDIVDADGRTPLHIAAAEGCDLTVIRRLMKKAGKAVQTRDVLLRYPLHWACANPQGVSLSRPRRRRTLGRSDSSSNLSLFSSRKSRERDAANMLEVIAALVLVFPRAVMWHDKFGKTPLDIARERHASEMIVLLLERVVEIGVDTFVSTAESVATRKVMNHSRQPTFSSRIQPTNWRNTAHLNVNDTDSTMEIEFTSSSVEALTIDAPFVFEDSCSSYSYDVLSSSARKESNTASVNSYNDIYSVEVAPTERRHLSRANSTSNLPQKSIERRHSKQKIFSSELSLQSKEYRHPRDANSSSGSNNQDRRRIARTNSSSQVLVLSKNLHHVPNSDNSSQTTQSTSNLRSILKRNSPNGTESTSSLQRERQRMDHRLSSSNRSCASDTGSASSKFSHSSRSSFRVHPNTLAEVSDATSGKNGSERSGHRSLPVIDDETERWLEKAERRLHLPKSNILINNRRHQHSHVKEENLADDYDMSIPFASSEVTVRSHDTTLATKKRLDDFIDSIPIESHGPFIAPRIKPSRDLDFSRHSENHFGKSRSIHSDKTVLSVQSDSKLFISDNHNRNSRRTGHKVVTFQNQSSDSPRAFRESLSFSRPRPEVDSEYGQEKIDDSDPWEDLRELRVFSVNPKSTDMQRAVAIKSINAAHSRKARMQ